MNAPMKVGFAQPFGPPFMNPCNPCDCGGQFENLAECFGQLEAFERVLFKTLLENPWILSKVIAANPCLFANHGPIIGVTDGSNAKPGEVGEFIAATASLAYGGFPQVTQQIFGVAVLSPGDWDCRVSGNCLTPVDGAGFFLDPAPAGASNNMVGFVAELSTVGTTNFEVGFEIIGQTARVSTAVPVLMPFQMLVDNANTPGLSAGTMNLDFEARRIR